MSESAPDITPETPAAEPVQRLPTVERTETPSLQAAMIEAYAQIEPIERTSEGQIQNRKYAYATLAEIQVHVRPVLAELGLAVYQQPITRDVDGMTFVGCEIEIMHTSGEFRRSEFLIPVAQPTAQSMGSAMTYARRYSYPFAIQADETDDDGAGASNANQSNSNNGRGNQGPPKDDGLPRAGTRSTGTRGDSPPVDQSEPQEQMIGRAQAITLTGLATRRATEFDGVQGIEILNDIAASKNQGHWEAMWPRIKMRQLHDVSKVIQEWEPPVSG